MTYLMDLQRWIAVLSAAAIVGLAPSVWAQAEGPTPTSAEINTDEAEAEAPNPLEFYNQGVALYNEGDFNRAIAAFSEAISLDPGYSEAYTFRARVYLKRPLAILTKPLR